MAKAIINIRLLDEARFASTWFTLGYQANRQKVSS
jgi:hypothetical protein